MAGGETFWSTIRPDEPNAPEPDHETSWWSDGIYDWWYDGDEWCTNAGDGVYTFSEMKPWMDVEDILAADSTAGKEAQDLLAAFENKVRTFREARDYVQQKGQSRGYYPLHSKVPRKGKGKGGGKSKKPQALATFSINSKGKGAGSSDGGQRPRAAGYLGCFICGDKNHDWRCPGEVRRVSPGRDRRSPSAWWRSACTHELASRPS